ncbi:MAG TPA: hypothetical protein VGJ15_07115, partial [Pirellulales bacterium]
LHIDGVQPNGVLFSAMAAQLTYSEAKGLVVLRGDGRSEAQLLQKTSSNAAGSRVNAREIYYWPATGKSEMHGMGAGEARFSAPPPPQPKR